MTQEMTIRKMLKPTSQMCSWEAESYMQGSQLPAKFNVQQWTLNSLAWNTSITTHFNHVNQEENIGGVG